jgi:hypothetical protein
MNVLWLVFATFQVKSWPTQPLDAAIAWLAGKPEVMTVADFGCGDARLAATVKQVGMNIGMGTWRLLFYMSCTA